MNREESWSSYFVNPTFYQITFSYFLTNYFILRNTHQLFTVKDAQYWSHFHPHRPVTQPYSHSAVQSPSRPVTQPSMPSSRPHRPVALPSSRSAAQSAQSLNSRRHSRRLRGLFSFQCLDLVFVELHPEKGVAMVRDTNKLDLSNESVRNEI